MSKYRYAVILDAGSSGTRLHVYRWYKTPIARAIEDDNDLAQLPRIKTKNKKWTIKVHPGISTFGEEPKAVGPEHLEELFKFALDVVPESEVADTPVFLLATAGMRLLPREQQDGILREVCRYTKVKTNFSLDCEENIQVISGETEGLYGWIATNYLLGGFDDAVKHEHGKQHHTYGFLDMGGASAQIAFAPNATESEKHWNDLKLLRLRNVNGQSTEYKVFVTTFLGYGANEARRRYVESLQATYEIGTNRALPDPCLPVGLRVKPSGEIISKDDSELYLQGTGKFSECLTTTTQLLDKDASCSDPPCLFHGIHVPSIDFEINHFIGVSNFWHGTHEIFEMGHKDRAYDLATYQKRVTDFCGSDWNDIRDKLDDEEWGDDVGIEEAADACFKAAWIINVLHEGIGVPRVGLEAGQSTSTADGTKKLISAADDKGFLQPFQAVNKIDDTEVAWVLGKIVLYASSQVPPLERSALDVGFGTNLNISGLPDDFQRGGGVPDIFTPNLKDLDDDDDDYDDDDLTDLSAAGDWRSKLLSTARSDVRIPGYILFLLILTFVAILLCGRERRNNLFRKIRNLISPGSRSISLGRGSQGKYERLLEEGNVSPDLARFEDSSKRNLPNPSDFELGPMTSNHHSPNNSSSEDDSASVSSRTSARSKKDAIASRRSQHSGHDVESLASADVGQRSTLGPSSASVSRAQSRASSPKGRKGLPGSLRKENVD